jgi:hypothetical protein
MYIIVIDRHGFNILFVHFFFYLIYIGTNVPY